VVLVLLRDDPGLHELAKSGDRKVEWAIISGIVVLFAGLRLTWTAWHRRVDDESTTCQCTLGCLASGVEGTWSSIKIIWMNRYVSRGTR